MIIRNQASYLLLALRGISPGTQVWMFEHIQSFQRLSNPNAKILVYGIAFYYRTLPSIDASDETPSDLLSKYATAKPAESKPPRIQGCKAAFVYRLLSAT